MQLSFSPSERAIVSGWAGWADGYAAFFLQCVRLWVADKERRQQGTGHATEQPDALPCIRLLADSAFTNQLRHVSLCICDLAVPLRWLQTWRQPLHLHFCASRNQIPERSPTAHRVPHTSRLLFSNEHRVVLTRSVEAYVR